jgi:hypothetical protein
LASSVDRLPLPDMAEMRELGNRDAMRGLGWLAAQWEIPAHSAGLTRVHNLEQFADGGVVLHRMPQRQLLGYSISVAPTNPFNLDVTGAA